jgi:3-dehydroquinate synthase
MNPPALRVDVPLGESRSYQIHLGDGLLADAGRIVAEAVGARRAVIVTQPSIARLWGEPLRASLAVAGQEEVPVLTFPAGERFKTLGTIERLYGKLYALEPAVDRSSLIVALGGGVVGDMAGYVAATYLRGIDYVQIPTTLLAMVDSSVGGKTGVDYRSGKNLIGAFHQPRSVVIDPETLATLPVREFRAGMAEVIKYGVIRDPALLGEIAERGMALRTDAASLCRVIARCCEIKADVVSKDEFERSGLRAILNFGHTIGHALESATAYRRYKHGEAVAIGMVAATCIGEVHGVTPPDVIEGIIAALRAVGLPSAIPADIEPDAVLALLGRDKKAVAGRARFVLAERIGAVTLAGDVSERTVREGLARAAETNTR